MADSYVKLSVLTFLHTCFDVVSQTHLSEDARNLVRLLLHREGILGLGWIWTWCWSPYYSMHPLTHTSYAREVDSGWAILFFPIVLPRRLGRDSWFSSSLKFCPFYLVKTPYRTRVGWWDVSTYSCACLRYTVLPSCYLGRIETPPPWWCWAYAG